MTWVAPLPSEADPDRVPDGRDGRSSPRGRQRKRREFPEEVQREAVQLLRTSELTIVAVAPEPDMHETVLRRWIARFGEPGMMPVERAGSTAAVGGLSPAGSVAENAGLKRELQRARMERDISRKAALIF